MAGLITLDPSATPTLTASVEECWVVSTSDGVVYSTLVGPNVSGAVCNSIASPTPNPVATSISTSSSSAVNSDLEPGPTESPALTQSPSSSVSGSSSSITSSSTSNVVGPIVGSLLGVLVIASLVSWYLFRRSRQRKLAARKHQWAMAPGKWVNDETKREPQFDMPKTETESA